MHFAAAVGVKKILDDPINSLITNLQGSLNVMNAAAINNLPTILASTSEIYGKNPNMPLREDSDRVLGSPLLSRWTYSEAKALDESIARHLFENSDWKVKIVRLFNVVGPRQSKEFGMVIPRFINAATNQLPLQVYGDGRQKRVFCHVEDAVTGIIQLWNFNGGYGEPFNIGGYEEISILDLASRIIKITNSSSTIEFLPYKSLENGFEDIFQRIPDISKMFEKTGWFPKHNVEKILSDTFLGQEYF
jgi:UDP-glucose 4-epimerase